MKTENDGACLLAVQNLRLEARGPRGQPLALARDVSFRIRSGEIMALAGESGSGKSLTALALARLCPAAVSIAGGAIVFGGTDVLSMNAAQLRRLRGGGMAYIFQEPTESMNPVLRIGAQIAEACRLHGRNNGGAEAAIRQALARVGLDAAVSDCYPHQLSGGMLQRTMIAMALACSPAMLVADEPTTALDVTVQQQILHLIRQLSNATGMAVLLITHNLGVVAEIADTLGMMYAGAIVETGPAAEILQQPRHPYTQALLAAVPSLTGSIRRPRGLPGYLPEPSALPEGCPFHPRCPQAGRPCRLSMPASEQVNREHRVRCHYWKSKT